MKDTSMFLVDFAQRWGLVPFSLNMDTLNTLFIGWVVFSIFVIVLVKLLYSRYIGDSGEELDYNYEIQQRTSVSDKGVTCEPPLIRRKAAIVPDGLPAPVNPPIATGLDPDAVRWINNVLVWFYRGHEGATIVKEIWNDCLNDVTVSSALESGVLVEVLEVLPQTRPPICHNVTICCDHNNPQDNMTVSCEIDLTAYLRVQTTRTQKEVTTESEYACSITPLRGRLNIDIETYDCSAVLQLVGWPEVSLNIEGIRNNSTGLDEDQLQEVLREVLTGALRNVILQLNFAEYSSFPRFKRARETPDPVIPVGYDSLVSAAPSNKTDTTGLQCNKSAKISKNSYQLASSSIPNQQIQSSNAFLMPFDSPNLNDSISTDEEVIEEAEESFTSMRLPSPMNTTPHLNLNPNKIQQENNSILSEESFVAPNIVQYNINSCKTQEANCDQLEINSNLNSSTEVSHLTRQSRKEGVQKQSMSLRKRTRSRSPVRRSVPRESILGSSKLKPIEPVNSDDEEEPRGRTSPLQLSWKNYTSKSSDEDDDPGYLKEILQQTSSLAGRSSSFNTNSSHSGVMGLAGKKLLVKVVMASDIGIASGIYVDVEIDEPNQKYTTTVVQGSSPYWSQQFVFDLNEHTLELLFEVFESSEKRFLGLGIVGIEELIVTPSQRQIISLQSRPYEKDDVTGSITCEFLFLDRSGLTDVSLVTSSSTKHLNGSTVKTTTTTYAKEPNHTNDDLEEYQTDEVAEIALKDLEMRNHTNHSQTKSTLIIHSSRKPLENSDEEYYTRPALKLVPPPSPLTATFPPPAISRRLNQQSSTKRDASTMSPNDYSDRGRSREKKMNFFGSLRKRFGRSKDRSSSMDPTSKSRDHSVTADPLAGRSVSVERRSNDTGLMKPTTSEPDEEQSHLEEDSLKASSLHFRLLKMKGFLTVPRLRTHSRSPGEGESARSSLSGLSGVSSGSTRTYFNEDSLLVVETRNKSDLKYYLVPISIQKEGTFRKRGKKMHIYNEHRFMAKHLSSNTCCEVCSVPVGRSLGKQAYKCRDCGYISHKPCHVKVDTPCPNSKVNSMDITYVRNKKPNFRSSELDRPKVARHI